MMNRIRPRQKRSLRFEALEGRLALSMSMGMGVGVVSDQAYVLVKSAAPRQVQVSFKGHVAESGSTVMITNLTGTIGGDHFTGYGNGMISRKTTGTISRKTFEGGKVYLSNSNGSVKLQLSARKARGKRSRSSPWRQPERTLRTLEKPAH